MLGGWSDHGTAEAHVPSWDINAVSALDHIDPQATLPFSFAAIPPLMYPRTLALEVELLVGDSRIASALVPFTVEVPQFAIASASPGNDVLTVYSLVDNRGGEEKSINIELDLQRGKSTLVAELLGPLRVPADTVVILGHEYKLSAAARTAERISARLIAMHTTQEAHTQLR
jgi:hypothetical protein